MHRWVQSQTPERGVPCFNSVLSLKRGDIKGYTKCSRFILEFSESKWLFYSRTLRLLITVSLESIQIMFLNYKTTSFSRKDASDAFLESFKPFKERKGLNPLKYAMEACQRFLACIRQPYLFINYNAGQHNHLSQSKLSWELIITYKQLIMDQESPAMLRLDKTLRGPAVCPLSSHS